MTVDTQDPMVARGSAAPGFEDVARVLEQSAEQHGEAGCAVSAYVDGGKVVDLWWGAEDNGPWQRDTLVMVWSCTKGALALCAQILYDRGLLELEAPVTRYWPEYGANGKESTLVKQVLNHTAGVLTFPNYWEAVGMNRAGLADWEMMTKNLAAAPASWEPGSRCMYHGLTIGYLVGELIRRIDGRTVGRFFADEVAAPLGVDLYIGAPESVLPRVTSSLPPPHLDMKALTSEQLQQMEDTLAGVNVEELLREVAEAREAVRMGDAISMKALLWSSSFQHPEIQDEMTELDDMNSQQIRMGEVPAINGITTARDLARMYALLAQGGELDGVRLVSAKSIERFSSIEAETTIGLPTTFCLGYQRLVGPFSVGEASEGAFGHSGAGGNLAFADLKRRLSFAFVKNRMHHSWSTATEVATAVYDCL